MKKFIILLAVLTSLAVTVVGQRTPTPGFQPRASSSVVVEDGNLAARQSFMIPRYNDTTDANSYILKDTLGAIIYTYDVHGMWLRMWVSGAKRWRQYGTYTASEGLLLSGIDFQLGGIIGSPSNFSVSRIINTNRKQMYWTNGVPVTDGGISWLPNFPTNINWSPFQFYSEDTLTQNSIDPATEAMPFSGLFAWRTLYYADGILKTQKWQGHSLVTVNNFKDTMTFWNQGGDYNAGVKIERIINPRGLGKQATGVQGTNAFLSPFNSTPTLLVNTFYNNNGLGTNYIMSRGWLAGITSYLVANSPDTITRFSYYQTGIFSTANVQKLYGLDFQHSISGSGGVDSSWGLWDQYGYRHYLRGSVKIGNLDSTVTGYQFKVGGATYHRGLVQNNQGTDVASTAGVMTLNNDGNIFEITGTNTITAINNTNLKNGYEVTFIFTSTATLTDGTANSGTSIGIELAGNTNFTASAGDAVTLILAEIGGTQRWREKCRSDN